MKSGLLNLVLCPLLIAVGLGLTGQPAFPAETVTIVDIDGKTTAGATLGAWTASRISCESDARIEVSVQNALSMTFARTANPVAGGSPLVLMANGDRLVLHPGKVQDDVLTATWHKIPSRPAIQLPLESVAAMILELPASIDDRQRMYAELQTLPAGEDVILLANGDRVQGEFETMDGAFVQMKTAGGSVKLDRTRVQAIRMNPELTIAPVIQEERLVLSLQEGSRLTFRSAELLDRELKCVTFSKQEFLIPVSECVACRFYGPRVSPVSEREPFNYSFVPYLSNAWSLVRNANVLRGPLSLRGTEYGVGLGVHSRAVVTYSILPRDREFRATVGIDDCAAGSGSVRFAVEVDDQRRWESAEVTGRSQPVPIPPIKLIGGKKLSLIVEFGASADISDYADWCDAIIIRD